MNGQGEPNGRQALFCRHYVHGPAEAVRAAPMLINVNE